VIVDDEAAHQLAGVLRSRNCRQSPSRQQGSATVRDVFTRRRMTASERIGAAMDGLLVAGQRPSIPAAATSLVGLCLRLLGDLQSVVDLNPKIPNGAFKLRVAEQELDRSEILGPSVD
jgi:hypothetical protein